MEDETIIRVRATANLGLVGCDREYDLEYYGEEDFQNAVDSGEIWAHIEELAMQDLDFDYERVD